MSEIEYRDRYNELIKGSHRSELRDRYTEIVNDLQIDLIKYSDPDVAGIAYESIEKAMAELNDLFVTGIGLLGYSKLIKYTDGSEKFYWVPVYDYPVWYIGSESDRLIYESNAESIWKDMIRLGYTVVKFSDYHGSTEYIGIVVRDETLDLVDRESLDYMMDISRQLRDYPIYDDDDLSIREFDLFDNNLRNEIRHKLSMLDRDDLTVDQVVTVYYSESAWYQSCGSSELDYYPDDDDLEKVIQAIPVESDN